MLKGQRGVSLFELVLGLGLSSLLLLSSTTLFFHQQQLLSQQIRRTQLLLASHHLARYLRGEIRRAGHAQASAIEVQDDKIALGYKDESGKYRRVSLWRDASQYKLKYCADSGSSELPLIDTCLSAINFSMLNDKLLSIRGFEVTPVLSGGALLRIGYSIALKGESAESSAIYVASRNTSSSVQVGLDGDVSP